MKIRVFGRDVEVDSRFAYIGNFRREKLLISINYNKKFMTKKDWLRFFSYIFLPYPLIDWMELRRNRKT